MIKRLLLEARGTFIVTLREGRIRGKTDCRVINQHCNLSGGGLKAPINDEARFGYFVNKERRGGMFD